MALDKKNKKLYVANREDNNVSLIDTTTLKEIKKINVEKAPFGVFTNQSNKNIYVTNVQSHSVSVIDKKNYKVVKNIKVGKWPYQVAFDYRKNVGYVSNQRENSISLVDLNTLEIIETKKDICDYPEGIDISYTEKIIVVACWFEDNIVLLDLDELFIIKRIPMSGGPRAFGKFIMN